MNLHQAFIKSSNIVDLFVRHRVPPEPDFLSVDIDSADLWVLRAVLASGRFRPRVVNIEYNSNFPPGSALTVGDPVWGGMYEAVQWKATCFFGTSAEAVKLVAAEYGYTMVHRIEWADLVLVRDDLLPEAGWRPRFGHDGKLQPWRCAVRAMH